VLAAVDKLAIAPGTRSAVIEAALREYVAHNARRDRDEQALHLFNTHADEFNAEMADILSYQVEADTR
jgi:metal-responsive CopG/Arc/MetJ family transcriptional regulator